MDSDTPTKWRRLCSSITSNRLVRIDPKDPFCNFDFLGLPLEIKLLIIFRYLSVKDVLSMSLISKDYKQFIDQYFLRKEVELPKCLEDYSDVEDRYVLSLVVDWDHYLDKPSQSRRERSVEVVKRLNLSRAKFISLSHYNIESVPLDLSCFFSFLKVCPLFAEISEHVFKNSVYVQSVVLSIFKSDSSLRAIEVLSRNAPYLREVTLTIPMGTDNCREEAVLRGATGGCSLSRLIEVLLEKTSITYLELEDFYEHPDVWHLSDENPYFLFIQSKTLENLVLTSSSWYPEGRIGSIMIDCPKLVEISILPLSSSPRCLFHLDSKINGLAESLVEHCFKLKWFNDEQLYSDLWFSFRDDGSIELRRCFLCSRICELYKSN